MYLSRRQTLAVAVLLSLCAVGGGILVWRQTTRGTVTVTQPEAASPVASRREEVVVHVCGAVKTPGVYRLPAESRIYEAIDRAGGILPEADQEAVNMAARVKDGEQIRLPRKGEMQPTAPGRTPATPGNGNVRPGTAAQKPEIRLPLHLNQASATELEAVPGIGPALASRIVAYRQANGPYTAAEDLLNVPGIGEKTLAKLRPYLLVP